MDPNAPAPYSTRGAIIRGTLLVLVVQVSAGELLKTVVLAGTGAVVSYLVTIGLKWVTRRWFK
jgi:hypothetical protein